jgi:HD superfamily phosphohydrolase
MEKQVLAWLTEDFTEPVRDPVWQNILLSPAFVSLVEHPEFQKLSRIRQLGPTALVYPGATHTRFLHSLGVFHLARRLMMQLLRFDALSSLRDADVKAFLAAALLHDLGHFPYAHSLKELPLDDHEFLTARIILNSTLSDLIKDLGADPKVTASIVDKHSPCDNPVVGFFRRLLSGVLDPDKLDYLNRDAYFCGVPYGLQDVDFILNQLVPDFDKGLMIRSNGSMAVENILFSKYLMYRSVYWHKTVRVATAMIKKCMGLALERRIIADGELYGLTDDGFTQAFTPTRAPLFSLVQRVANRQLYKVVFQKAFDDLIPGHKNLMNLQNRFMAERRLAKTWGIDEDDVVIDIPERISFESDLLIAETGLHAMDLKQPIGAFGSETVGRFTSCIRFLRVLVSPEKLSVVKTDVIDFI